MDGEKQTRSQLQETNRIEFQQVRGETHNHNGVDSPTVSQFDLDNRYLPKIRKVVSAGSNLYVVGSDQDMLIVTGQSTSPMTIENPSGVASDGQKLLFRFTDESIGAVTLTWDSKYRGTSVVLPPATVASKWTYVGFMYNSIDDMWDCVASVQQ